MIHAFQFEIPRLERVKLEREACDAITKILQDLERNTRRSVREVEIVRLGGDLMPVSAVVVMEEP